MVLFAVLLMSTMVVSFAGCEPVPPYMNQYIKSVPEQVQTEYKTQAKFQGPTNVLFLENKNPSDWSIIEDDGIKGAVQYNPVGRTFNYYCYAQGIAEGTEYALIYYPDPWPGIGGIVFDTATAVLFEANSPQSTESIVCLTMQGQYDIGTSLPIKMDDNYPDGAKIWLVPTSLLSPGNELPMVGWNASAILFETELITFKYIDDVPNANQNQKG